MANLSVCRVGLELGLSSCAVPDQFFQALAVGREWQNPAIRITDPDATAVNIVGAHDSKGIIVRGIQFDYQYSYIPDPVSAEDQAVGVTSIRSALVIMRANFQGSLGQVEKINPDTPLSNILFHGDTLRWDSEVTPLFGSSDFEEAKRYRIVWRGMDMMPNYQFAATGSTNDNLIQAAANMVPRNHNDSRHVRCRSTVKLASNEGLFFVTEVVNPFLTSNPILGLDLFGSCAIRGIRRGNVYDT